MKQVRKAAATDPPSKVALIIALYTGAGLITASGALFLAYSFIQNIQLKILNVHIPGFVVALLMLFFGVRSFISVCKLSNAMLKKPLRYSLGFGRTGAAKGRSV